MSVLTPNMNLIVSTIGVDSGLSWEQNLNASLTLIDQHNHTSGNGVPIQPNGLNINSDLPFNNNQATNLKSILFTNQSSLATLNALYTVAGDLYYNDATGPIQITLGGTVNATSSGISSGSATASFVSSVLVVNAASNTPANIQCGSVLLGNNTSGSKFLTLAPPSAMAADFGLVLPSIPAASSFLTIDTSGNFSGSIATSLGITASNIASSAITTAKIADSAVTTIKIADANVTTAKITDLNVTTGKLAAGAATRPKIADVSTNVGTYSGTFSTSSDTAVNVTGCAVTLTTTGKPVLLTLRNNQASSSPAWIGLTRGSGTATGYLRLLQDGSEICRYELLTASTAMSIPPSAFMTISTPAAGAHTYQLTAFVADGVDSETIYVTNVTLLAYEMA